MDNLTMESVINLIQHADASQTDAILDAAISRRHELFPGWDMHYVAIPKEDAEERKRILSHLTHIILQSNP